MAKHSKSTGRKPTNLSLDVDLVAQARALGINLSQAAEDGIGKMLKAEQERQWREENKAAIDASNTYIAQSGLPLEKLRLF
jgi:antitoxin CcdA